MREGRLGNYRIVSRIGEGGMGAVYHVEHALLGRAAAIKVLQPELSQNQEMIARFFNEARATAQLQHPGIVDVFDFGFAEDGAAFIVMELLAGESLASRIARDGRLSWPQACNFARQIASSLAAAHRAQIIHRDLKPDNVFLVADRERGEQRTKVLDFGIAKLVRAESSSLVKTRAGFIMGTPAYMSPQQCRGAGQVDHRTDIYSLGCILFEMVCGRPPFVGEGFGDLIHAHTMTPPPPPRLLAPELPEPIEHLILRMLAKSEAERPQSMEAVADELDGLTAAHASAASGTRPGSPGAPGEAGAARAPVAVTLHTVTGELGTDTGQAGTIPPGTGTGQPGTGTGQPGTGQLGVGTGRLATGAAPPRRTLRYGVAGAAVVGVAGLVVALVGVHEEAPLARPAAVETSPPAQQPAQPPPAPRKRSPKIGRVKELPVEPASDPVASAPRRDGAPGPGGGGSTAARSPAGPTARAPTATTPAAGASTAAGAGAAGAGSAAGTSLEPDVTLVALMTITRMFPWFDTAGLNNWLVAARGPEVSLTVTSSPRGAEVALDGQILGTTPLSLTVDRGMYDFALVLTLPGHGERTITMSAALDRTEHVVLPPLVARRVVSKPPGAELLSNGEVIGETPVEIELPQSDGAEPFTLRLTGYLEQTIAIVPNTPGTTTVALEREPQNVVHELTCDPECEVVLDHEVVGRAAPGTAYRVEFLEHKGQWRTYVLRPLEKRYRETSFRAPADRSVKTTIRLPCAPRARPTASADPRVYDPYDACRDR